MGEKKVGETAGVVAEAGGSLFQSLKDVGAKFYKSDRLGWTFAVSDEDASKSKCVLGSCFVWVVQYCTVEISLTFVPPPPTPPVQK